jgi:hypothetical protein
VEGDVGEPVAKNRGFIRGDRQRQREGIFDHLESLFVVSKIATRATHEFRNSAVDKILPRLL